MLQEYIPEHGSKRPPRPLEKRKLRGIFLISRPPLLTRRGLCLPDSCAFFHSSIDCAYSSNWHGMQFCNTLRTGGKSSPKGFDGPFGNGQSVEATCTRQQKAFY